MILEMIDTALDEHMKWLGKWHRAVVCGLPPDPDVVSGRDAQNDRFVSRFDGGGRGLLEQPVFGQLWSAYADVREFGRSLALRVAGGETLPVHDYDAFIGKSECFIGTARRICEAFQRAVFDLDPLTGVHNRRSMMAELSRERHRSIRTGKPLCIGLCDIDHFKAVNDEHGHLVGDSVLLAIAGRLIANLRPYDSIYRFGGEEFLLAFTETDRAQAAAIAERLRKAICAKDVTVDDAVSLRVTASFGLCMVEADATIEAVIQRADNALYRAKRDGRNRVALWWEMRERGDG